MTPHKIFEYHKSIASSGSSTNSVNGFSSKINENSLSSGPQLETFGTIFKNILKPILFI